MIERFSSKTFREVLGRFATGVCVATSRRDAQLAGITINSFASVSLTPALVLFSVGRALHSCEIFQQAQGFTINVLGSEQQALSNRFARAGEEKWLGVAHEDGLHDGVILPEALASFDCRRHAIHDGGDHLILVGEVVDIRVADRSDRAPLVYYRGAYRSLTNE